MNSVCLISAVAAVNLILVFARLMYFESKLSIAELKPEVLRCVLLRVLPTLYVVRTVTSANHPLEGRHLRRFNSVQTINSLLMRSDLIV